MYNQNAIDVGLGKRKADLVFQGGKLVNVFTAEVYEADVAVAGEVVAAIGDVSETVGEDTQIVEGQVHGAAAQGIGAALLEEFVYNDVGQPQAANLADYLAPSADSLPFFHIEHTLNPSPYTPGGMKGMGEGGTSGAYSCAVNAVLNALGERADGKFLATPLSPKRLRKILAGSS